jgi:thiol-disulfide isomerase/thioredoxin
MKYVLFFCVMLLLGCKEKANEESRPVLEQKKEIPAVKGLTVVDYDGLKPLINKKDDRLHVVNFWATWCAPCVKELPYFEALHQTYDNENIDVLLVSLDFPDKYESKLLPFIKKYKLKSDVIALDDTDQNRWIPAIHENWSGAIPATIIYKGSKRKFYEQSFTNEELQAEIEKFLN